MKKYGYNRQEVIFVGDSPHDKAAALNNGITFVAMKTEENDWHGEKLVISNLTELELIIRHINDK